MNGTVDLGPLAQLYRALGDETRLRIVALLAHGELCVCHLEAALDLPQPTVSRQLGVLRHAGVVASRRKGTWIHYRLSTELEVRWQLRALLKELSKQLDLKKEVARIVKSMGPEACR